MSLIPQDPHQNLITIDEYNFEQGTVNKYVKGNFLGKGGFARCYELYPQDSKTILAVKIIQKSSLIKERSKQKLISQIKIHKGLNHQHVVKFYKQFQDNINVYLILQLCTNRTLNDLLKRKQRLSENQIRFYMEHLLNGLEYLHKSKIIHRDLKLGNLFLDSQMHLKIGDFGLASRLEKITQKRKTVCGTPNYIAPEILESKGHSFEVDIWSFGVILYTLAYGKPPFQSKQVKQTYSKIKKCDYTFPQHILTTPAFRYLISSILQKDPSRRPTIEQIRKFQFFRGSIPIRQPSINFRSIRLAKGNNYQRQLSDNGKLYTNNQIGNSGDTPRPKSEDKFLGTSKNMCSTSRSINVKQFSQSKSITQYKTKQNFKTKTNFQEKMKANNFIELIEIKKWIDYSSKYGIGYLLSNGSIGVYFNDGTKILAFNCQDFAFIEKRKKQDIIHHHKFFNYPVELKKKVNLYNHFKEYLLNDSKQRKMKNKNFETADPSNIIYVRRWYRGKHAVVFRLNNKSIQVIFVDHSELLINATKKQVIYFNKKRQQFLYEMSQIAKCENKQLNKRFNYTRDLLNEMATKS